MISQIKVTSSKRNQFIDITSEIEAFVKEIKEGVVTCFVPHTTAGITINEGADPSVQADMLRKLEELVPHSGEYKHAEGNADAHIKASLMGSSVQIIVKNGKLQLGTWQSIFFCEFDGPRVRKVLIRAS